MGSLIPALGVVAFILGPAILLLAVVTRCGDEMILDVCFGLSIGGLAVAFGGLWGIAKVKRRGWLTLPARCTDRELLSFMSANGDMSGRVWGWRILCEYEYQGKKYTVTPRVGWCTWAKQNTAVKYLEKRVAPDGGCRLRVNPKSSYQTELAGDDLVDKLFF